MFRQLTICDAFGNQVNKFNPQNLFLKYELDQEHTSEQGVVQAISNNQSTSYEYGTNTFFISDIIFSLGTATTNFPSHSLIYFSCSIISSLRFHGSIKI